MKRLCRALFGVAAILFAQNSFATDYQTIRDLLVKNSSIRSIDQLLDRMDEDMFDHYLLMHSSGSLQQASVKAPRVILFNKDATFIMAFTGRNDLIGSNRLEMIQFNSNENHFEFYDVTFPANNRDQIDFSDKNPKECQSCHRVDLRPNWDAYPFWKDAYGTIDGGESRHVDKFPETKLFADFLAGFDQSARYKRLKGLKTQNVNAMARVNLEFTKAAARLNFKRIAEYLQTTPDFAVYRFAFMGAIKGCNVDTFIPANVRSTFVNNMEFYVNAATQMDSRIREEQLKLINDSSTFYRPAIIGRLRYLLEGRRVPAGSWSMVLGAETFNMSTGTMGIEDFGPELMSRYGDLRGKGCEDLKKSSLAAFGRR